MCDGALCFRSKGGRVEGDGIGGTGWKGRGGGGRGGGGRGGRERQQQKGSEDGRRDVKRGFAQAKGAGGKVPARESFSECLVVVSRG